MKLSEKTIQRLKRNYGNWVLITGATSGIGREMALKFGEAGFNLVITGRREHLLNELGTVLFDQYKTETIPVVGDLSNVQDVEDLKKSTSYLPIGIVILNAGYGTSGKFVDAAIEQEVNMLELNCKAVLILTHYFANKMKAAAQPGAIVLLSSIVAFQGVPNAANYAATKAYVQSLGEALAIEFKADRIAILCAAPGPVESGFSQRANMIMGNTLKVEQVAVPIINAIGQRTKVLPGFLTKFLAYNLSMTPRWLKIRIMEKVMAGFTKHQG